jgi:hypothetical protein
MHLKRFIAAGLLVTALVTAGSCTSEDAANDQSDPEWLFSLQATGVTSFDPETGKLTTPAITNVATNGKNLTRVATKSAFSSVLFSSLPMIVSYDPTVRDANNAVHNPSSRPS